jgi:hypothetical protein
VCGTRVPGGCSQYDSNTLLSCLLLVRSAFCSFADVDVWLGGKRLSVESKHFGYSVTKNYHDNTIKGLYRLKVPGNMYKVRNLLLLLLLLLLLNSYHLIIIRDRESSVGVATCYGLNGLGIESR